MGVVTPGVYAIRQKSTGRQYVGSSLAIEARWRAHISNLNRQRHSCPELLQAWLSDGESGFDFVILSVEPDRQKRLELELSLLRQTSNPFNVAIRMLTGARPGYKHTPEAIQKMRLATLGKPKSPEHRAKLSQWRTGRKFPAHAAALRGKPLSEETKRKMSIAQKGRKRSPETCAKLSAAMTGRKFTDEWKANLRESFKSRTWARFYGDKHDFFELIEAAS